MLELGKAYFHFELYNMMFRDYPLILSLVALPKL